MSTIIMAACWPLGGMSSTQKAVLISLADNANDQGVCWPSIATIGKRTCLSERAVQNAIKWLEQAGLVGANRENGRHTSYTVTPAKYSETPTAGAPPHDMHPRSKCTPAQDAPPQQVHPTPAGNAGDPRTRCVQPPHQVPTNRKEPSEEPSLNRQPARRAPRVALHGEIRSLALPDWLPADVWQAWCEHREAKAADKSAPWTHAAALVAIRKLESLRAAGHSPQTVVDEAVFRGWTGLFEVKAAPATGSAAGDASAWWLTKDGVEARGREFGIAPRDGEIFLRYKARVIKRAGPGPWMEDMLARTAKESESTYEQLLAFFSGVRLTEAEEHRPAA